MTTYSFDLISLAYPVTQVYEAAWPIELVSEMTEVEYSDYTERIWYRIAHVFVPDCRPGDILDCKFMFEVTNDEDHALELSGGLIITPNATGTAGVEDLPSVSTLDQPAEGKFVTRFGGYNVTPAFVSGGGVWHGMHHGEFHRSKDYIVPEGISGDQYVIAACYCGGSTLTDPGGKLIVEPFCGDFTVKRTRNAS